MTNKFNYEKDCTVTRIVSRQELFNYVGETIHVIPYYWNNLSQELTVLVDGKFEFIIPFQETSIYTEDLTKLLKEIKYLFKIGVLSVKVLLDNQGNLYLSRKANMEDALDYFQSKVGTIIKAQLRSINTMYTIWDLGAGILGRVILNEVSNCFTPSFKEVFSYYDIGRDFDLKILNCSTTALNKFDLSFKQAFKVDELSQGDLVLGRIASFTPDRKGVFVELSPLASGIVDIDDLNVYPYEMEDSNYDAPYIIIGKRYSFIIKKVLVCPTRLGLHCRLSLV